MIICEIVCVEHQTVKIGGEDCSYELVRSKFLKLNSSHLQYVMDCKRNTRTSSILPCLFRLSKARNPAAE